MINSILYFSRFLVSKSLTVSAIVLNQSADKINSLLKEYKNVEIPDTVYNDSRTFMWDGYSKWNIVDS